MTNQPTYQLTGVGARDAFTSKKQKVCPQSTQIGALVITLVAFI